MWAAQDGSRAVLELAFPSAAPSETSNVGWPERVWFEVELPASEARVELTIVTMAKPANRLPEAVWLSFQPKGAEGGSWLLHKVDEPVRVLDVVPGGGRTAHAIGRGLHFQDAHGSLSSSRGTRRSSLWDSARR